MKKELNLLVYYYPEYDTIFMWYKDDAGVLWLDGFMQDGEPRPYPCHSAHRSLEERRASPDPNICELIHEE